MRKTVFEYRSIFGCLMLLIGSIVVAQTIQLSPEQQRMLNQLPAAERQQAQAALRQLQSQVPTTESAPPPVADLPAFGQPSVASPEESESAEPKAHIGSTLVISFTAKSDLTADQRESLLSDPARSDLQGSAAYVVTDNGNLLLPGVASIPVRDLTAAEITLRLGAERHLDVFNIAVDVLEPARSGAEALEPFGYDVFDAEFPSVTSGPVPPDYVLGPGDSIRVQLFGNVNGIYEFEVSRDGVLNLPEVGPVTVAGLPFSEFREDLEQRVSAMLIGTQVSATMGQLRANRVFVLGDAKRPGSYVVNGLATISSAIYAAGGISRIGTLRDIQLKRQGEVVSRLDLYDLLVRGDTSDDTRLRPGDVIFIPPVGDQVSVTGAVKRPAVYEVVPGTSVDDVLALAGGLTAQAYSGGTRLERIDPASGRMVLSLDSSSRLAANTSVQSGDVIFVPDVLPLYQATVELSGHVYRDGPYQWRPGMRLTDLVPDVASLRPGADKGYLLIRRIDPSDGSISVLSVNLEAAFAAPGSDVDEELLPRDQIQVFSLEYGRQRVIEPLLEELELQSRHGLPNLVVTVAGNVRAPGIYPLETGMRVSDLIRAAGNLTEEAYSTKAELVRYEVIGDEYRRTKIIDIDLAAVLRGVESSDLLLEVHDSLRISRIPSWDSLWTVTLAGEVTFPGEYRVRQGETLAQLLERAGGLTEAAFPEGAVFLRESLRQLEQQQIESLVDRMEADLTSLSLEAAESAGPGAMATGQELLRQLRRTEATGRLVVNLSEVVGRESQSQSIELRDRDRLLVPKRPQSVTVIGETQQNTSHLFVEGLTRDDYIAQSGGLTRRADRKLIYVVRANGAVEAGQRSRWFSRQNSGESEIRPGDTIVVPMEIDKVRPLTLWANVTQILYQAAIAIAAVDSFGN